jgi:leucyl-tRNA synthetase
VVNPDEYYKKFGADTLRMYLMFLGPFEQGGDWQDSGIVGVKRFLEKVCNSSEKIDKTNNETTVLAHQIIKKVTEDLENLKYNTAISALMIFTNKIADDPKNQTLANFKMLLLLLAPFAPHLSEELWQVLDPKPYILDSKYSIHNQPWPKYDSKLVMEERFFLVIQVNGKIRDKIEAKIDISEKEAKELALSQKKMWKWTVGREIKKVIFVPGKLINLVIQD